MDKKIPDSLKKRSITEPYARLIGIETVDVSPGYAKVRMEVRPELLNIFGAPHGGALFSLIDEAFQLACNTHGVLAVALNVNITYVAAPELYSVLEATASEIHRTRKTASYFCEVRDAGAEKLIATANALAYRTGKSFEVE
jgi:acyl-CoA thioesterase